MAELDDLPTLALDAIARDGKAKLVTDGENYAAARWRTDIWIYATPSKHAMQLDFEPTHYCP